MYRYGVTRYARSRRGASVSAILGHANVGIAESLGTYVLGARSSCRCASVRRLVVRSVLGQRERPGLECGVVLLLRVP